MSVTYTNAFIINGCGDAFLGHMVVKNGRIEHIGAGDLPASHLDEAVVDLDGKTILPGMIDCHVHLRSDGLADTRAQQAADSVAVATMRSARNAMLTLQAGITTVRDCGSKGGADFALRKAAQEGLCKTPRLFLCGCMICMTGGHGWMSGIEADGVDEVRRAARRLLKEGADHIKLVASGGILSPGTELGAAQFTVEELRAAVEEAHSAGKTACAHAHGTRAIKNAIRAGVDSVEHGYLIDDEGIQMMVERGTYLVATSTAVRNVVKHGVEAGIPAEAVRKASSAIDQHISGFKRAHKAGVRMAMGTDSGVPFTKHGKNLDELVYFVEMGMSPMEAICTATLQGARLLKMDHQIGSLEEGKLADYIIVDANPLEDIASLTVQENIDSVYIEGRQMVARAKQPELV